MKWARGGTSRSGVWMGPKPDGFGDKEGVGYSRGMQLGEAGGLGRGAGGALLCEAIGGEGNCLL